MRLPRAVSALALVLLLGAAVPSAAPAARGKAAACSKKRACRSAVARAPRAGMPAAWAKGLVLPLPPAPGGGTTPPPDTTAPPPPPPPVTPPSSPYFVSVKSEDANPAELKLYLSRATVSAGRVTIEFNNKYAADPHNLLLRRPGVMTFGFPVVDMGQTAEKSFTLTKGTYTVFCDLFDHEELGMKADLIVE